MRCAGAKEERGAKDEDGRARLCETEADDVSPPREERREIRVLFIRAGINGGSRNKVWEESRADLSDVLQGVIFISCLVICSPPPNASQTRRCQLRSM